MALTNKGSIKIGDYEFTPQSLKIDYESLSSASSGRVSSGVMVIDWVYNRIRKLEIQLPPMSSGELTTLFSLVQGKIFNATFFDVLTNAEMTKEFYCSNSSVDCYSGVLHNGLWQGAAMNFIETKGEKDA